MLQTILNLEGIQKLSRKSKIEVIGGRWNNICPSEGEPCDNTEAAAALIARNCLSPLEPLFCNGSTWQSAG